MSIEQFTATAICPRCSNVATHRFRMPRFPIPLKDSSAAARLHRQLLNLENEIAVLSGIGSMFDDPRAAVIRQCSCGYEWGQA